MVGATTKIVLPPDMREIRAGIAAAGKYAAQHPAYWYLDGMSLRRIAKRLTDEGAPTARLLAGQARQPRLGAIWFIADMLRDPLNVGVARSSRYRTEIAPPDRAHDYAWARRGGHANRRSRSSFPVW